jgi:hypothetical protein
MGPSPTVQPRGCYDEGVIVPSVEERRYAAAMHLGSMFAPFVVPAAVWAFARSRQMPYVAQHARRALVESIVWKLLFVVGATLSLVYTVSRLWGSYQQDWVGFDWREFAVRAVIGWAIVIALGVWNLLTSLRQAHKAYQGAPIGR